MFEPGTLRITWSFTSCDVTQIDDHVTHFIVYYCVVSDTTHSRCAGTIISLVFISDRTVISLVLISDGTVISLVLISNGTVIYLF